MAGNGQGNGKAKGRKDRELTEPDTMLGPQDLEEDDLEVIPTAVPRVGDGYEAARDPGGAMAAGFIGEAGRILSEEDLRRINTPRGLIQLIKSKNINLDEVRKTLLYEQELRQLQVELVRLQRWVQADGQRIAILVEGRDAAGKGGTIRRFTEHLNPRAMRVVALPKPTDDERGQWYFQRYIRQLPNKGEIVFFDRSWYNRAVVEPVMGFCSKKEHQRFLQQVTEFEHMLYEDGVTIIKFWFSISKEEQAKRFEARRQNPLKQWKLSPVDEKAQEMWDSYTRFKEEMFSKTHTTFSPWIIVKANDKQAARLEGLRYVLNLLPYRGKDEAQIRLTPDPNVITRFHRKMAELDF
ncbi:PPK2 domain-containing protein [Nitrospira defluvii]|uniref:ADP/GDP-polyphosphate phosphotransferase n=2 Tax=Nitrospira defluvii TaxID=330214 RepID=A0ABM8RM38_9BACT|nr:polyphosphate kinase 2 [Nitrospira defluvii]CAE6760592.1 PPK2 domain-containing protein [Nitrospira defluvii]